jgi:hypothetical protein
VVSLCGWVDPLYGFGFALSASLSERQQFGGALLPLFIGGARTTERGYGFGASTTCGI